MTLIDLMHTKETVLLERNRQQRNAERRLRRLAERKGFAAHKQRDTGDWVISGVTDHGELWTLSECEEFLLRHQRSVK